MPLHHHISEGNNSFLLPNIYFTYVVTFLNFFFFFLNKLNQWFPTLLPCDLFKQEKSVYSILSEVLL